MAKTELVKPEKDKGEAGKVKPRLIDGDMKMSPSERAQLAKFVKQGEALETQGQAIRGKKTSLYEQIEDAGYDRAIVKQVIKLRAKPADEREYDQQKFDFYMQIVTEELGAPERSDDGGGPGLSN